MRVDRISKEGRGLLKESVLEAAADIEKGEAVAGVGAHVKRGTGAADRVRVHRRVVATAANVEADTDDGEVELPGLGEKAWDGGEGGAKLDAELAEALGVVGEDADDKLGTRVCAGDFVQLIYVVKGHGVDAHLGGVADKGHGLAGVGENDPVRVNAADCEDLGYLTVGGTVEAGAECG